ncbi:urea amidolyase associated protein UAAP1 [Niveispirillum sp. KHB5.9]|uniref:urea amidolyase associated protein UAAP1 n=1 Tax=Niveispirillum sp. KHB5.9 TaxID=3400269 RepID=UPI003A89F0C5
MPRQTAEQIAANRARYLELKSAASGRAPLVLPPPTKRDAAPPSADSVKLSETLPGGWYWTGVIRRGQVLTIANPAATPGVSLLAWNLADPTERYNHADTIKIQWTAELRKGRVLFSDMGRVLLSIVEDSCGKHDTLVGGSTPASVARVYGPDSGMRNARDNFILAAGKHGLTQRDIPPCISFFAPVTVTGNGKFAFDATGVQPGDFVSLRAEMDLIVAISNTPHPLASPVTPSPVELTILTAPDAGADDLCRTATAEAARGFVNTDAYLSA